MATIITTANHIQIDSDFITDGMEELPFFMKDKATISKLTEWYCTRWDTMDGEIIKLAYFRLLDNASGELLDMLGERIGIFRYNQTDAEYSALIKLRSFRQTAGDTRDDIVTLMKILFFGEAPIITKQERPLIIKISNTTTPLDDYPYLHDVIGNSTWLKPSNVGEGEYIISVVGDILTTTGGVYTMVSVAGVPNSNSFVEVIIPASCISNTDVSKQLEDMFPVNTNLWVTQTDAAPFYLVDDKELIDSTNTTTLLDAYTLIQDLTVQRKTWEKPEEVGDGEVIVTVSGNELTTSGGVYQMTEFSGGLSDDKDSSIEGMLTNWIHSSARSIKNT